MSALIEIISAYKRLSFTERVSFYTTVSNDIVVNEDNLQTFLVDNRITDSNACIYCGGEHVVRNGIRKDGVQRYLCRGCRKSFIPSSNSVISRTRKHLSVWVDYIKCMTERKTLQQTADVCHMSVSTAFVWRHKILDALSNLAESVYLTGTVEADETFFNVSYKGNHSKSRSFTMPRQAHKRGNDVHTKGLSSEKLCVPCAVCDSNIVYAKPGKPGKISSECISAVFEGKIDTHAVLCTDNEKAYIQFALQNNMCLIQTDSDRRVSNYNGASYGIQRINAYHSGLKGFIRGFHGVSSKHLGHYIVWNALLINNNRKREEFICQLLGQILDAHVTFFGRDISGRPPIPNVA